MKFAACLVLMAIAITTAHAESPTMTKDLLTGSKSKPASEEGSAEETPKSYCPNIMCPAVYQPVSDENGVMYPNKCSMEAAKCKGPRENPLDEYKRIYGKEFGAPRDEDSEKASKKCASACPDVVLRVCGSDGVWYSNPCELKIAACKNPEQNIVEEEGACSSKKTANNDVL
ncbi:Kazal-type serine protease inhibitor domain [Phytophthora infestans]|uniref:Kazal-type serine protease inhibitor domain n=1 Tax=Phytophthora infestans TaxID=4787 RepID=A0A833TAX4_PHYIN|nr:Kazal-type serine protease inhibitor domain [Phytophthora infestans]